MADKDESSQDDKTEDPTPQRMEDFRKEGQVAQSRELTACFVLISTLGAMYFTGPFLMNDLFDVVRRLLAQCATTAITDETIGAILLSALRSIAIVILPIAGIGFVAGALGTVVQIGFNISTKPIEPNLSKINPITGFQRVFSINSLVEGVKALAKLIVICAVAYGMVMESIESSSVLAELETQQLFEYMTSTSFRLIGSISVALLVIALMDFSYQKFRHYREMMMTKKELRDEIKQREGDPLLKARIRSVQRDIARRRMMEQVPKADVIVTNPTHIAVAIQYDLENMDAPKVVAKGADFIAQNIREVAKANQIPIVENIPLARALHKTVKVGAYIPRSLYQAVAEVLAYVYRLRGRITKKKS